MHRPSLDLKAVIDYTKTWKGIKRLLDDPTPIAPDPIPEHLRERIAAMRPKLKLPQLRGNVRHTMEHIIHIFLREWNRAKGPILLAITTTNGSLARTCGNKDPKTAYRHILALVELGFLRAKVRLQSRLQLLLNPALIQFVARDGAPAPDAEQYTGGTPLPDDNELAAVQANILALVAKMTGRPLETTMKPT